METYIRLTRGAQQLLDNSKITLKYVNSQGEYLIRHSDDIKFKAHYEYSYEAFAKKLGIKPPTKKMLARWAEMTENNDHPEVRCEIARWANVKASYRTWRGSWKNEYSFEDMFRYMAEKRDTIGYDIITECYLTDQFLIAIEQEYGRHIAEMIDACL